MAGTSLLLLIDDIATVLDDVAVLTKVAAKKTSGVLGDDLALNAEQVTGVQSDRELPVVWSVAKGSFVNKLILTPTALLLSAFLPVTITPLLMLGGAYLCFEGFEKIAHKYLHSKHEEEEEEAHHREVVEALVNSEKDLVAIEKEKIKGAIRTDFILSAEIVVISLGTMRDASIGVQIGALSAIGVLMTVGVYGLVAAIVRLDNVGLAMLKKPASAWLGKLLLLGAPLLMKFLAFAGTIAMFLVGGGILAHGIPGAEGIIHAIGDAAGAVPTAGPALLWIVQTFSGGVVGVLAGALLVGLVTAATKLFRRDKKKSA